MDVVSRQIRSKMMASIRGKNTKPELLLRKALHGSGFRFRLHDPKMPGRPDIVLRRWNAVIFVHGCFWHRHIGCRYSTNPATRSEFWQEKFAANIAQDFRNQAQLHQCGIRIGTVWECALRKPDVAEQTFHDVREWLEMSAGDFETGLPSPA